MMSIDSAVATQEQRMLEAVKASGGLQTDAEAVALYRLAAGLPDTAKILEIGSYLGASTIALGHGILSRHCELYCLDCWQDYRQQGFHDTGIAPKDATDLDILNTFIRNTAFLGSQLRVLKGTTAQFEQLLPTGFFDLVFVDAAHDYANVIFDIRLAFRVTKPNGLICGHDYHSDGGGVIQAVNELIYDNKHIVNKGIFPGTSIWYAMTASSV